MTHIDDIEIFAYPAGLALPPIHPGQTIAGERGITADTALRLAKLFGTSALFWMNLQSQYDLAVAERDHGSRISAEVEAA